MSDYERKIIYLSVMDNGGKGKSAGFVKTETCGDCVQMDMHVSGMQGIPDQYYDILAEYTGGEPRSVGRIFLRGGKGEWKETFHAEPAEMDSRSCKSMTKLSVKLSESKSIEARFPVCPESVSAEKDGRTRRPVKKEIFSKRMVKGPELKAGSMEKTADTESIADTESVIDTEKGRNAEKAVYMRKLSSMESTGCTEKKGSTERTGRTEKTGSMERTGRAEKTGGMHKTGKVQPGGEEKWEHGNKAGEPVAQPRVGHIILNDKWQQLMRLYPLIHPYEDNREYISIQPKDFVIMTGDYQHLANNSFLLHGFYNYRYLILGREKGPGQDGEEAGTEGFYLGVPGVYYEREKMVALMFGFEAFDCIGGHAEPGNFGYYLRRVRI